MRAGEPKCHEGSPWYDERRLQANLSSSDALKGKPDRSNVRTTRTRRVGIT